jgi:hypothetical protein
MARTEAQVTSPQKRLCQFIVVCLVGAAAAGAFASWLAEQLLRIE